MTTTCLHPQAFRASDGFGGVRCLSCAVWIVARPSLFRQMFRWLRGGAR